MKLPSVDGGLSIQILHDLCKLEPDLKEYIYVFDISSRDLYQMQDLMDISSGVVIWGGDSAVSEIRKMARPNTKLIEWGHKISFAYVSEKTVTNSKLHNDKRLIHIAENMCQTNQLLCNSCQGIYVDTNSMKILYEFGQKFSLILDVVAKKYYDENDLSQQAQSSLELYTNELESYFDSNNKIIKNNYSSVTVKKDIKLEPSIMFKNCWVKRLPQNRIISNLYSHKNHLQTVALISTKEEEKQLSYLLFRSGVNRITDSNSILSKYCGSPHDGELTLSRYVRRISWE